VIAAPLIVDKEHLSATGGKCAWWPSTRATPTAPRARPDWRRARHLRRCRKDLRLPRRRGVSVVDRDHRRSAAGGKADCACCPIWPPRSAPTPSHFPRAAQAILTTDTVEKTAFARLEVAGQAMAPMREVRIAAFGKGSGMIHPQLVPHATMLVYVMTDAAIEPQI
jgi:glutamate N-acetyltransferase / amino-acid N-acetyltransferase